MSNGGNLAALLPLLIFMAVMIGIGFYVRQVQARGFGKNFVQQYFIGNHDLGGFVLAMTTVATYSSVSSFVGGPGMAWQIGFGWIYMAVVQVTAIFLVGHFWQACGPAVPQIRCRDRGGYHPGALPV